MATKSTPVVYDPVQDNLKELIDATPLSAEVREIMDSIENLSGVSDTEVVRSGLDTLAAISRYNTLEAAISNVARSVEHSLFITHLWHLKSIRDATSAEST